jgi:hypothetical protein
MQAAGGLEAVTDADDVLTSIGDVVEAGNQRVEEGIPVHAMVPGSHEAYVRILHPAWESARRTRHVRWADIAASTGARLEGTVAFRRITVPPDTDVPKGPQGAWDEDAIPVMGTLPETETNALLALLGPSSDCWFMLWEGWDGLRLDPRQVVVGWQGNPHLVFRGPSDALRRADWSGRWQVPHVWFADDRTWCVGTGIEGLETYVAGSEGLVERIDAHSDLETLRVSRDDIAIILGEWLQPR